MKILIGFNEHLERIIFFSMKQQNKQLYEKELKIILSLLKILKETINNAD